MAPLQHQTGKSSSEIHNANMQEIYSRLSSSYQRLARMKKTIVNYSNLVRSTIDSAIVRTTAIQAEVLKIKARYEHPSTIAVPINQDHYYQGMPQQDECAADWLSGTLSLPVRHTRSATVSPTGDLSASIKVLKRYGAANIDESSNLNNALDQDPTTFWHEVVYSKELVKLGSPQVPYGVGVELELSFNVSSPVNEIYLHPFCEFPIKLAALTGYPGDADIGGIDLMEYAGLQPIYINGATTILFPTCVLKRIKLLVIQEHATLEKIARKTTRATTIKGIIDSGNESTVSEWHEEYADNLSQAISAMEETSKPVLRYKYLYGFYTISASYSEKYSYASITTKPIEVSDNMLLISVSSEEDIPKVNGVPVGEIRYYVEHDGNWVRVCPVNKALIEGELLSFTYKDGVYVATLAFPPKEGSSVTLYENGTQVTGGRHTVLGQTVTLLSGYNPYSVYTATYIPDESAKYVDVRLLKQASGTSVTSIEEIFTSTGQSVFTLSLPPYVDISKMDERASILGTEYNPSFLRPDGYAPVVVTITDTDGNVIRQPWNLLDSMSGNKVLNITNYSSADKTSKVPRASNLRTYEYYMDGKQMVFTSEIPAGYKVSVTYQTLASSTRIKAEIQRNLNIPGYESYSPSFRKLALLYEAGI